MEAPTVVDSAPEIAELHGRRSCYSVMFRRFCASMRTHAWKLSCSLFAARIQ